MPHTTPLLRAAAILLFALSSLGCIEIRREDEGGGSEHARSDRPAPQARSQGSQGSSKSQKDPNRSKYAPNEAGAPVHVLGPRYRPLERIVGRRVFPFQSKTSITTIGKACYTPDLNGWLKKHPPGTPVFEAVMRHEQLHAKRQLATGVDPWIDRYLHDKAFMWSEEQLGWYEQITHLRGRGLRLDDKAIARNLDRYSNFSGSMVGYAEALKWAQAVLQGRWRPKR